MGFTENDTFLVADKDVSGNVTRKTKEEEFQHLLKKYRTRAKVNTAVGSLKEVGITLFSLDNVHVIKLLNDVHITYSLLCLFVYLFRTKRILYSQHSPVTYVETFALQLINLRQALRT